jgi:hypothetical protein
MYVITGGGSGTGFQPSLASLRSVSRWFATEPVSCNPSDWIPSACCHGYGHVGARCSSVHLNRAADALSPSRCRAVRVGAVFRHGLVTARCCLSNLSGIPVRPRGFSRRLFPRRDEGGGGAKSAHAFRLSCADLPTASDVRCWPHHFDLATLFSFPTQNSDATGYVGAGLSPWPADRPIRKEARSRAEAETLPVSALAG